MSSLDWKSLLKAVLAALVPVVYTVLVTAYPDFPLPQDQFVQTVLWIIGMAIGGWQVNNAVRGGPPKKG